MSIYKQPVSDQRIAFEAWYSGSQTCFCLTQDKKGYIKHSTRVAWRAWQAATVIASEPPQPQQEPVAWTVAGQVRDWSKDFSAYKTQHYVQPVYIFPPQPQQEPVAQLDEHFKDLAKLFGLPFAKALLALASTPPRVPHGITQIPQEHSSNEEARP